MDRRQRRQQAARLYKAHAARLLAYVRAMCAGNGHVPEDVVHEVFLNLMRKDVEVEPDRALPYLFSCVRNRLLNLRRADRRRRRHEAKRAETLSPQVFDPEPGREQAARQLETALARLPREQREAVVMRIWGGMTLAETALVQQVPLKTAASRYEYGVRKLRRWMEPADEQTDA